MSQTLALSGLKVPRAMLVAPAVIAWLCADGLIWFASPWTSAILIAIGTLVMMAYLPMRFAVLLFVLVAPFDLHRQIGNQWIYLDLLTAAVFIPLLRLKRWPPLLCWLLVPFFVYFVSTGATRSVAPAWFLGYTSRWLIALCFSAAVAMSGAAEALAVAVGITLVPLSIYGLYQLLINDFGELFNWMNPHMLDAPWMERSYSFLWHPNAFGDFAGVASVMMIALGVKNYNPRLTFSLGTVGLIGVLSSGSRGAEIAFGLAVLIVLTQTRRFWSKFAVIALLSIIVWGALHYDVIPLQRAHELDEFTMETRLLAWGEAFFAWQQHPWIGLGATNFSALMENFGNFQTAHAHNTYLQILAENGLVGFLLFYVPILYLLWRAWIARSVPIVFAGGCALIVWLAHSSVDVLLEDNPQCLLLVFAVIGLIVGGLRSGSQTHVSKQLSSPLESFDAI
jgi:O-antigen ligase